MERGIIVARLLVIRSEHSEQPLWIYSFLLEDRIEDAQKEMRTTVKEFLKTKEGCEIAKNRDWKFNWEDAMTKISHEHFATFGMKPVYNGDTIKFNGNVEGMFVNPEEILWNDQFKLKE